MRPLKLFRRADERPPLKDRLAALKARLGRITRRPDGGTDTHRRVMLAGSLAAAIPLPALAAAATNDPHPDADLLALRAVFARAREAEAIADQAYIDAWREVLNVLAERPDDIMVSEWEWDLLSPPTSWRRFGGRVTRFVPPNGADTGNDRSTAAWTGAGLRTVIEKAVPVLGRGGQTPHRVRHWRSLLSIADAFDVKVGTAEIATGYNSRDVERNAARKATAEIRTEIKKHIARTPEGMAALVEIAGEYPWKDTGGIWPNLLRSAAIVSGVPLAALEHEYASTRRN